MDQRALAVMTFAVATFEGKPGDRNWRNHNPCNLKFAEQAHATGADAEGFAIFDTLEHGFDEAETQIIRDATRNPDMTIAGFIELWAPAKAGNPHDADYAHFVAGCFGLTPNATLKKALDLI